MRRAFIRSPFRDIAAIHVLSRQAQTKSDDEIGGKDVGRSGLSTAIRAFLGPPVASVGRDFFE